MQTTVSKIKRFIYTLAPHKIRLLTILAAVAVGAIGADSPGAGSGIGG